MSHRLGQSQQTTSVPMFVETEGTRLAGMSKRQIDVTIRLLVCFKKVLVVPVRLPRKKGVLPPLLSLHA